MARMVPQPKAEAVVELAERLGADPAAVQVLEAIRVAAEVRQMQAPEASITTPAAATGSS
jgi:hypothetical protein